MFHLFLTLSLAVVFFFFDKNNVGIGIIDLYRLYIFSYHNFISFNYISLLENFRKTSENDFFFTHQEKKKKEASTLFLFLFLFSLALCTRAVPLRHRHHPLFFLASECASRGEPPQRSPEDHCRRRCRFTFASAPLFLPLTWPPPLAPTRSSAQPSPALQMRRRRRPRPLPSPTD